MTYSTTGNMTATNDKSEIDRAIALAVAELIRHGEDFSVKSKGFPPIVSLNI